jgi:hypothetical protein
MEILIIGGVIAAILFVERNRAIQNGQIEPNPLAMQLRTPSVGGSASGAVTGQIGTGGALQLAGKEGTAIAGGIGAASVAGTSLALGAATAGIGAAVGIFAALWAAHEKRVKEAKDENSSVNLGVQQVDQVVKTVFGALNAGQMSVSQAMQGIQVAWQQYWQLVAPHIQPGRNGCQAGAAIPIGTKAYFKCPGNSTFDKSWGGGCCVGSTIRASLDNCLKAIQQPGFVATMYRVYGSKYGANDRAMYQVSYTPVAASLAVNNQHTGLLGFLGL